ncbi:hypothetical protein EB118_02755 [bacterium]|nr:hypothetical protein [Actinomycetota bacterium]NDG29003.1 hypothetical protein [bacterium]
MASLEEVFGGMYGKGKLPKKETEVHSSQKVYNSPTRRTEAALQEHSKLINELERSLPIANSDEEMVNNYSPAKLSGQARSNANQIEPFTVKDYTPPPIPGTYNFAYESPIPAIDKSLGWDRRIDKIMKKLEYTPETSTHDLILYVFTGVFFLFVLDTFVNIGRRSK